MYINFNDLFLRMQQQLDADQAVLEGALLIELVQRIRPEDASNNEEIDQKFQAFVQSLLITPNAAITLQNFVLKLINQ